MSEEKKEFIGSAILERFGVPEERHGLILTQCQQVLRNLRQTAQVSDIEDAECFLCTVRCVAKKLKVKYNRSDSWVYDFRDKDYIDLAMALERNGAVVAFNEHGLNRRDVFGSLVFC